MTDALLLALVNYSKSLPPMSEPQKLMLELINYVAILESEVERLRKLEAAFMRGDLKHV